MAAIDPPVDGQNGLTARASLLIDLAERALLIGLYVLLARRLAPSLGKEPLNSLLLISESIIVGFVVFRRTTLAVSRNPLDWLLALAGTLPPLLLRPGGQPFGPPMIAGVIVIVGTVTHLWAKLALRRSFGIAAANRGVKIGGPYRIVRHPMYLGYAITWAGFVLLNPTWANAGLILFAALMQVMRTLAEERLLMGDAKYRTYAAATRFRIVPGLF